jgi:hypothetical protein
MFFDREFDIQKPVKIYWGAAQVASWANLEVISPEDAEWVFDAGAVVQQAARKDAQAVQCSQRNHRSGLVESGHDAKRSVSA